MKIASVTITNSQAAKIEGAIQSALQGVDTVVVIDTGIQDDTLSRVLKLAGAEKVIARSFTWCEDFSAARNYGIQVCEELGFDWMLIVDSDERMSPPLTEAFRQYLASLPPSCPGVSVRFKDGSYPKARFLRLPTSRRYRLRTHEVISTQGFIEHPTLRFSELGKSPAELQNKFTRDEKILREEIEKNPKDSRSWYYLGESLKNMGQKAEAIECYKKAFETSSWDEEAAWSAYQVATLMAELKDGDLKEAIDWCALGLTRRADVAELPWLAGYISFRKANYPQAVRWARLAVAACKSHEELPWKRIGFTYPLGQLDGPHDIARHAFTALRMPQEAEAEEQKRRVAIARRDPAAAAREQHIRVQDTSVSDTLISKWPIGRLLSAKRMFPSWKPRHIELQNSGYRSMNPSVASASARGEVVCVRTVNYLMDEAGHYVSNDGIIRTENFLVLLDEQGQVKTSYPIVDRSGGERTKFPVKGYEDIRLFFWKEKWWGSATVRDRSSDGRCEIALLKLNNVRSDEFSIEEVFVQTYENDKHQKNWMPLVRGEELLFVYSISPLVLLRVEEDMQARPYGEPQPLKWSTDEERGGSQVIQLTDGSYLAVTHQARSFRGKRAYSHRFVRLRENNGQFQAVSATEPLLLAPYPNGNPRIEFAAGIALSADDLGKLVVSFGIEDKEAHLAEVQLEDVLAELKPLPGMEEPSKRKTPFDIDKELRPIMLGVPCLADAEGTKAAIASFQDPFVHVVAIDNGAEPEIKKVLHEFGSNITLISNPKNVYVNPAWNQLAEKFLASDHQILVLANSDLVVAKGWAESLLLRQDRLVNRKEFWFGHEVRHLASLLSDRSPSGELAPADARFPPSYGGFFALTREAVRQVFPIPESLLIWYGDDWIFETLDHAGFAHVTLRDVAVWHKKSVSCRAVPEASSIAVNDRGLWDSKLGYMSRRVADALKRGRKMDDIERVYSDLRDTPSDINEHLPILRSYAERCQRVCEFGIGRSTWALLHARPKVLRCYDIKEADMQRQSELASAAGIDFRYQRISSVEADIDETDLLFIDSLHVYEQLSKELSKHSPKVKKYIVLHDTETFGAKGEDGKSPGLVGAYEDFLAHDLRWQVRDRLKNNNGLTILERISSKENNHG